METTRIERTLDEARERFREEQRRVDELATLSAHLSAATARMVELVWTMHEKRDVDGGELPGFLAYRCGMTRREAGEYVRIAEALQELPATRAAVRARRADLYEGARPHEGRDGVLRGEAARARRGAHGVAARARASRLPAHHGGRSSRTHELEYVDYHFEEDGSLYLRARLAAEDGVILVKALDAARERVFERRREERAAAERDPEARDTSMHVDAPQRPVRVEALAEVAQAALAATDEPGLERAGLVVHVDADALTVDGRGRSELEDGPMISSEAARRLGCDADVVAQIDRDGLPVSVGRKRRTVPPALRRLLEARDDRTCCFPGCERSRHLQAHHRHHWAHGGETSLENLVLLCFHHHRLVHEGGYRIEEDPRGGIRFRNRSGVLTANLPPRPPPSWAGRLLAEQEAMGLDIGPRTNQNGGCYEFDLGAAVSAVSSAFG